MTFSEIAQEVASALWGYPTIILLVGTHLYLTVILKFPQRYIFKAIKMSFKRDDSSGDVSQFGALMTSLAATIGTGNIVGIAVAVTMGGPGAVLWCWLAGVFGIATKYAEGLLAVKYRVKTKNGTMLGGPMYALERGLNMKWLAVLFCVFTVLASFGIGNLTQVNAISVLLEDTYSVSPYLTGGVLAVLVALVIFFGIKGITRVCSMLVPVMAVVYVLGCVVILIINAPYLRETISVIFSSAFSAQAAAGGFVGSTLILAARFGVARGLFSNESGLGSAPIVAAAAKTRNSVRQALVSSTATFWDTVVMCALTGLVVVSTIVAPNGIDSSQGAMLTRAAFGLIPVVGPLILTVGLISFAASTVLGWSYYGEKALEYLGGSKSIVYYRIAWVIVIFIGATMSLQTVWNISDSMNALMAYPNIIALLLLSGVLIKETKKYLWNDNLEEEDTDDVPTIDR